MARDTVLCSTPIHREAVLCTILKLTLGRPCSAPTAESVKMVLKAHLDVAHRLAQLQGLHGKAQRCASCQQLAEEQEWVQPPSLQMSSDR